jgi:hypothetical protein
MHCAIMIKSIKSFCCHEKAVEYDEYDDQGLTCITELSAFTQNMLSEEVFEVDASQYLEVFHILGKKNRRVFPSCVYKSTRDTFSPADGLYTHFKFAK